MECSIYLVSEFWSTWKAITYSWVHDIAYSIVWEYSHKCTTVLNSTAQECFVDTVSAMEMYYIWSHLHELVSLRVNFLVAHTSLLYLGSLLGKCSDYQRGTLHSLWWDELFITRECVGSNLCVCDHGSDLEVFVEDMRPYWNNCSLLTLTALSLRHKKPRHTPTYLNGIFFLRFTRAVFITKLTERQKSY